MKPPLSCLLILMSSSLTACRAQILPIPSPNRGHGAGAFVKKNGQSYFNTANADPQTIPAFSSPLTNPSLITVTVCNVSNTTINTPTDTAGNTYVDSGAGKVNLDSNQFSCQFFYALNTHTTASNVVSISNTALNGLYIAALEFTGGAASSPVRGTAKNANATSTSTLTSTAIAGTVAGDLSIGVTRDFLANLTGAGGGFTNITDCCGVFSTAYNLSGAGGSLAVTWTTSNTGDPYGAIAVAFKLGP
jgi:hypothetical protein